MAGPRASWAPIECSGVNRGVEASRWRGGGPLAAWFSCGSPRTVAKCRRHDDLPHQPGDDDSECGARVERGSAPSVPEAPGQAARDHGRGGVERQVLDDVGQEDPGELLTEEEGDAGPDPGPLAAGDRRDGEADGPPLGDGPPAAGEGLGQGAAGP